MAKTIYTIGHSTHFVEHFIQLLERHSISVVADVRSIPYSRMNPQYNQETLGQTLKEHGIRYVFLGNELGARPENPQCYAGGIVKFDRLARTPLFQRGLERLCEGAESYTVALMCAEKDPLDCHRTILVARHLDGAGVEIRHILSSGAIETHQETVARLIGFNSVQDDLFLSYEERQSVAFSRREREIAYSEQQIVERKN